MTYLPQSGVINDQWGETWLSNQGLLPSVPFRNDLNDFPAADLSETESCVVTRLRSRMQFAGSADFATAVQSWDYGSLKNKALILVGAITSASYNGGVYIMKELHTDNRLKKGYQFRYEENTNQWQLFRHDTESSATSLGTVPLYRGFQDTTMGMAMHVNGTTGLITCLVKFGGEQWWPIFEVTESTYTTFRYAGVTTVSNAKKTFASLPLVIRVGD